MEHDVSAVPTVLGVKDGKSYTYILFDEDFIFLGQASMQIKAQMYKKIDILCKIKTP